MTATCPCCGQPVAVDPVAEARAALTPVQRAIFDVVLRRPGLSQREIAGAAYADDIDGGPECASAIAKTISLANARLVAHGLRMVCGHGSRLGYRVERVAT